MGADYKIIRRVQDQRIKNAGNVEKFLVKSKKRRAQGKRNWKGMRARLVHRKNSIIDGSKKMIKKMAESNCLLSKRLDKHPNAIQKWLKRLIGDI